jgi:CheY-like chemotaxis protein
MSKRTVLVIEDDEPKQRSILGFLRETLAPDVEVVSAESLASAVAALSESEITFAVVDMSIPTFDFVKDRRGGGQPQGFGGADILRFIDSETASTKSVVVTQYEEFVLPRDGERRDPRGLEDVLRSELDQRFLGVIHYSSQHGAWRQSLRDVLDGIGLLETR